MKCLDIIYFLLLWNLELLVCIQLVVIYHGGLEKMPRDNA